MLWILMDSVERVKFDLNVKNTALVFEGLRFRSHLDDHLSKTLKLLCVFVCLWKDMYFPHRKTWILFTKRMVFGMYVWNCLGGFADEYFLSIIVNVIRYFAFIFPWKGCGPLSWNILENSLALYVVSHIWFKLTSSF